MNPQDKEERISVRVAAITKAKLLRLASAEGYGTQTTALAVAIERLYRETFGTDRLPQEPDGGKTVGMIDPESGELRQVRILPDESTKEDGN